MNETVPMWAFVAILGGFQLLLGMMFMRLWKSVDENTAAVTKLSIELPTSYESKTEAERHHDEDQRMFEDQRQGLHAVRDRMHALDLRVTSIDGGIRAAQAGLRD